MSGCRLERSASNGSQIWPNGLWLRAAHCAPFDLILFAVFYFYYSLYTVHSGRCLVLGAWCSVLGNDAELNLKWNCNHKLQGGLSTISFFSMQSSSKGLANYKLKVNRIECALICLRTWKCLSRLVACESQVWGQAQATAVQQVHAKSVCQHCQSRVFFQLVLICMQTELKPDWHRFWRWHWNYVCLPATCHDELLDTGTLIDPHTGIHTYTLVHTYTVSLQLSHRVGVLSGIPKRLRLRFRLPQSQFIMIMPVISRRAPKTTATTNTAVAAPTAATAPTAGSLLITIAWQRKRATFTRTLAMAMATAGLIYAHALPLVRIPLAIAVGHLPVSF